MSSGPLPLRASSRQCCVTAYVARMSLPSTRTPGKPKPAALEERDAGLLLDGLGDGPLVVLAEEDDRCVEARGVDERLVDVALGGGTVAEVADDSRVAVGVAGADVAVHPHAHRVTRRVQRLGPDDDRVEVE